MRLGLPWSDPRVKPPYGGAEVDWTHPLASGLKSLLLADEGAGDLFDRGTTPAIASRSSGATWEPSAVGTALTFDNTTSAAVTVPNVIATLNGPFTQAVCCRLTDQAGSYTIIGKKDASRSRLILLWTPTLRVLDENVAYILQPNYTAFDRWAWVFWTHTAASGVAGTSTLYWDGAKQAETGYTFAFDTSATEHLIGSTTTLPLLGEVAGTRIWNRALSASEVLWATVEPYAFLRPIIRRRYFVPAPSTAIVPILMAEYRQRRN